MRNAGVAIGGAGGKLARWRPPDRRAWRAPLRRNGHGRDALPWRKGSTLRSGGVIAIGGAVGKLERGRSSDPTRSARAATKKGIGSPHRGVCPAFFVAAAASPSAGPSVSRHSDTTRGVHCC